MDSVKEEVRRKLAGFERDWMGGDNLSIVFCGAIESQLELEQDPDMDTGWHEDVEAECDATLNALTDAIMSAFKRGSGVVVKGLEWGERVPGLCWQAKTELGFYSVERPSDGRFWSQPPPWLDAENVEHDTLEAAQAACQADFAKRITSAVEPSGVVSSTVPDDVLEAVGSIRGFDAEQAPDADQAHREWFSAVIAALSSRTEEEPKWRPIADAPYRAKVVARRSSDGVLVDGWVNEDRKVVDHLYSTPHECDVFTFAWPAKPASSRTKEDVRADVIEEIAAEIESPESPTLPANIKQTLFCCAEDPEMEDAYRVMDVIASHVRSLTNGGE